jgi:hypothetical protein
MNLIRSSNSKIEVPPHVHEYILVQMLLERVCAGWEGKSSAAASDTFSVLA